MSWSTKYERCISCGTTETKHIAKGLCINCYNRRNELVYKNSGVKRGTLVKKLNKEVLERLYSLEKKSLADIADIFSCSRQYIKKKMTQLGIERRSRSEAREVALNSNKLFYDKKLENGERERVFFKKYTINENFFSSWSDAMAYVLGVIYTDGNLSYTKAPHAKKEYLRFSVAQKEPELLEKILLLLDADYPIRKKSNIVNNRKIEINYFEIQNESLCKDLIHIGVTPKKSLTIKFPTIPNEFIRHFIRGCWDGDGSISKSSTSNTYRASFVSGSYHFVFHLINYLKYEGFEVKPYKVEKKNPIFYFKIDGNKQVSKLFHYLYDSVSPKMYLDRKYKKFFEADDLYLKSLRYKPYKRSDYIK